MRILRILLLNFSILIGITSVLVTCKPDQPDPAPTELGFFPLGEVKEYVLFKPGTWWVYKNSLTSIHDSIKVFYSLIDTIEGSSKKWHFKTEVFDVQFRSLSTGHYYNHYMRSLSAEVTTVTWICMPNLERREPFEGDITAFYYPFLRYRNVPKGDYDTYCTTIKDTFSVKGNLYKNVAVFYVKSDDSEPIPNKNFASKYYWAPNFGIIKKEIFHSKFHGDTTILAHSWDLIKSNIVQ